MKLIVVSPYRAHDTEYPKGAVIDVPDEKGRFLLRDAPGCFQIVHPVEEKEQRPVRDKMQRRGRTK